LKWDLAEEEVELFQSSQADIAKIVCGFCFWLAALIRSHPLSWRKAVPVDVNIGGEY